MFCKNGVLENFAKFTGKSFSPGLYLKSDSARCFSVNFMKFLRTASFTEQLQRLLPSLDDVYKGILVYNAREARLIRKI